MHVRAANSTGGCHDPSTMDDARIWFSAFEQLVREVRETKKAVAILVLLLMRFIVYSKEKEVGVGDDIGF